ncbi:MAG TPA: hypothetical protein VI306_20185, partial [Pyrinomonadaceae bacterium]
MNVRYALACRIFTLIALSLLSLVVGNAAIKLTPHRVSLASGRWFNLNLPENFEITPAVEGLKRVRFMAKSPDNRIFVTDMYDLSDNRKGVVY